MTREILKKIKCFPSQQDEAATQSNANRKAVLYHKVLLPGMRDTRAVAGHGDGEVGCLQPL